MLVFEIHISDEMQRLMRMIRGAASGPMTDDELIKRWIVKGVAVDGYGTEDQATNMLRREFRMIRK